MNKDKPTELERLRRFTDATETTLKKLGADNSTVKPDGFLHLAQLTYNILSDLEDRIHALEINKGRGR